LSLCIPGQGLYVSFARLLWVVETACNLTMVFLGFLVYVWRNWQNTLILLLRQNKVLLSSIWCHHLARCSQEANYTPCMLILFHSV
jgi:hypothetical protein